MLKTLLLVLGGLGAGLVIAFWFAPDAPPPLAAAPAATASVPVTAAGGTAAARLAALESALTVEAGQRAALEQRVEELAAQLEELGQRPAGPPGPATIAEARERFQRDAGARSEDAEQRFNERLVAAGFAPDRADWIIRRTEELRMEALQAQYDAQRSGRPVEPRAGLQTLRSELGDADYERYLQAEGRPAAIPVRDVLASSPAERSGLKPGDEILSYGGKRVFDMPQLNSLTLEGTPGESVVVEVRRDGQSVQVVIPRGPLGITGGGFRGR
jgi:hypothetical protein